MPFYKLFCIAAHYPEYKYIKDLVSQSAKLLLDQGAAVRQIEYLGTRPLAMRMKRHKAKHDAGDFWTMRFDTSPRVLAALNERMRTDPRVIRWTMLKLGERLEDVVRDPAMTVGTDESVQYATARTISNINSSSSSSRDDAAKVVYNDPYSKLSSLQPDYNFTRMSSGVFRPGSRVGRK